MSTDLACKTPAAVLRKVVLVPDVEQLGTPNGLFTDLPE